KIGDRLEGACCGTPVVAGLRADAHVTQPHWLAADAAAHCVEPIVTAAARRRPFPHLLDKRGAPDRAMRMQAPGSEQRVKRGEDPLLLAGARCMLHDGGGEAGPAERVAQEGRQELAEAIGLYRQRWLLVDANEVGDRPALLGGRVLLGGGAGVDRNV